MQKRIIIMIEEVDNIPEIQNNKGDKMTYREFFLQIF